MSTIPPAKLSSAEIADTLSTLSSWRARGRQGPSPIRVLDFVASFGFIARAARVA
jgi:hypothetical protein